MGLFDDMSGYILGESKSRNKRKSRKSTGRPSKRGKTERVS